MNRALLASVVVLGACGAGFGLYHQREASTERQAEADLADAAGRLKGAMLDLQDLKEREAVLNEHLRVAADREGALVSDLAALADLRGRLESAKDDRDVYKSLLEEMLDSPGHRELLRSSYADPDARARGVLLELRHRQGAMLRKIDQTLGQLRGALASAERILTDVPTPNAHSVYERCLWDLQAETERAARMADDLAAFVVENQSYLVDDASAVNDALDVSQSAKALLAKRLTDIHRCVAMLRTSTLTVHANEDWQSSDLTIAEGETLAVWAWGKWYRKDASANPSGVGPEGETGSATSRIAEKLANGALLLRIQGSPAVYAGCRSLRPNEHGGAGRVEFRINDQLVADNRGELIVTIWAIRPLRSE